MTTENFIRKLTVKILALATLVIAATLFMDSMGPVISTELAMGQMLNSNKTYILMVSAPVAQRYIKFALTCIGICFAGSIACDTYNFYQNQKNQKNQKENN